ncbi:MAG: hypothetical protein ACI4F4_05975 [Lachnospiraceae bacterium]
MKKYLVMLMMILSAVLLCACSTGADKKDLNSTEEESEVQVMDELEYTQPTESEEQKNEDTVGKTEEVVSEENYSGTEYEEQTSAGETEEAASEVRYPGADVVEIVNLRGDKTTVYKLADGTYMDRIERRFTYNGTDTWTDEDGVEWNEVVK